MKHIATPARAAGALFVVLSAGLGACGTKQAAVVTPIQPPEPAPAVLPSDPEAAPLAEVVESREAWDFSSSKGTLIRTAHYRLFTTVREATILKRTPLFLEAAITHYRSALGPLPAPPIRLDTFLMANRPQWQRITLEILGRDGERYINIPRGGFATGGRAFLWDIGLFDTLAIAAHEGWHQYTQRTFREGLPIYLEEGIATFMEGHRWLGPAPAFRPWANVERFDQLRKAHGKKELRPLAELLSSAPQDLLLRTGDAAVNYYAQVWALTHFLNEGGGGKHQEAFRRLLQDAAGGLLTDGLMTRFGPQRASEAVARRRGSEVIEAYFGDLTALETEFTAFVDVLVRAGSRQAVVSGISPFRR